MPSIENLRKQAKRIVRWHREGHFTVAALIREHLSAFEGMSDQEVLSHELRLSDALEVIARQRGFSSWQALLEGAEKMPESHPSVHDTIAFTRAEPQLFVTNLGQALRFYTESLGFTVVFSYGEPPFYAQVQRGNAHLNLRWVVEPLVGEVTRQDDCLAATICVEGIKELFLEYQAGGISFHQSLRTEPWGARTFIVADPDGNLILFAE